MLFQFDFVWFISISSGSLPFIGTPIIVCFLRDRGAGGRGGAIFLELQRISKKRCLVPPAHHIESLTVPPPPSPQSHSCSAVPVPRHTVAQRFISASNTHPPPHPPYPYLWPNKPTAKSIQTVIATLIMSGLTLYIKNNILRKATRTYRNKNSC